ncbi:hypothetical protein [Microbacterium sp. NPDC077184]|uniref:hypothetical protein n=1 Tax=Microbacterium sp. NPDC077184 TaxID=3154764 RepID=UPI003436A32C
MTLHTKTCPACDQPFQAARSHAVTCSPACRMRRVRAALGVQRERLAADAAAAAETDDVAELRRIAAATAALLTKAA